MALAGWRHVTSMATILALGGIVPVQYDGSNSLTGQIWGELSLYVAGNTAAGKTHTGSDS